MTVPDEAVEAAARAVFDREPGEVAWESSRQAVRDYYLDDARAALTAAAPFIAAQAWDEGAQANGDYELDYRVKFDYGDDLPEPPTNPYRSEQGSENSQGLAATEPTPEWPTGLRQHLIDAGWLKK